MASIRKRLEENLNDSKNTRMDIASAGILGNWRPDELTHMSRFDKIVSLCIEESNRLKRPIFTFEAGAGECWPLRVLYKAYTVKKSDVIGGYVGIDIDPACEKEHPYWPKGGQDIHESAWFQQFNGTMMLQDLTVDPKFPCNDETMDFFWTTEVIEHMLRDSIEPWIADVHRCLRPGGLVYVSTPNHDGSNDKLPEDHFYEWGFQELKDLLTKYFELQSVTGTFIQLPNFKRAQAAYKAGKKEKGWEDWQVDMLKTRYGRQWLRVMLAAPHPEYSNNCAWILRKK